MTMSGQNGISFDADNLVQDTSPAGAHQLINELSTALFELHERLIALRSFGASAIAAPLEDAYSAVARAANHVRDWASVAGGQTHELERLRRDNELRYSIARYHARFIDALLAELHAEVRAGRMKKSAPARLLKAAQAAARTDTEV